MCGSSMTCIQKALLAVLLAFLALTGFACYQHGVCGFIHQALATPATMTLTADLVIALSMVSAWMWRDARTRGVSPWPFLCLTVVLGSVGPLVYLILKSRQVGCTLTQPTAE
jgi:hypothetical protein